LTTTLFTLSKSWLESSWLFEQLGFAAAGDSILLLQDAVLALQSPISLASFVAKCDANSISVYALAEDCQLRGVENQYDSIKLASYNDFVNLVGQHSKQVAW